MIPHITKAKGSTVILVLIFSGVFLMLTTSLTGYLFIQQRLHLAKENRERAVHIAEAGLDYYKWFLSHYPDDTTDGTGNPGPYVHSYSDPESDVMGTFSLEVTGYEMCNAITAMDITSTGWTVDDPSIRRNVYGKYSRPSVAEYAYILNSNVWAGADRVIIGPYHSNGGIRMDGDNRSTVTSALTDWQCSSSFGCNPTTQQDGVFGAGDHPELWSFPVPTIDFGGITVDLTAMKTVAQSDGVYFAEYGGSTGQQGYRLVFNSAGTFDAYRVTGTSYVWGYHTSHDQSVNSGHVREYDIITTQEFLGNYQIPPDCPVVFVEGKVWIEGVVDGKVTVAAANLINATVDPDVVLNTNLTYEVSDGSDGITVVGERNVRIPLLSPVTLDLQGIFIAQTGRFGRNHYRTSGTYEIPSAYDPYVQQDTLNLGGTIVSNGREGTRWTSNGVYISGYNQRNNSYDRNLATSPPPLTPFVSQDYRFIEWRED